MRKPGIFETLEYSELFYNCIPTNTQNPIILTKMGKPCVTLEEPWDSGNPRTFRALIYLKSETYSEPSKRFKMECFTKVVESYNYFHKVLYLGFLTGIWIYLSLNKYSQTCRVTSRYVFFIHIQNPVYYCKSRRIQAYSRPIQTY